MKMALEKVDFLVCFVTPFTLLDSKDPAKINFSKFSVANTLIYHYICYFQVYNGSTFIITR